MTAAAQDWTDSILAAEYVLRLLGADEERKVERRLRDDRKLEDEVGRWVRYFTPMADEVAPVAVSGRVKKRMMSALFDSPAEVRGAFSLVDFLRGAAFASVAAFGVFLAQDFLRSGPEIPAAAPTYIGEVASEDSSLRVLAVYDGDSSALKISRTAGAALPGRALELWAIVGDNAPVSLGVLPDGGATTLALPVDLAAALPGAVLAISDEPAGGSPTGQPTGAVLAVGQVQEI